MQKVWSSTLIFILATIVIGCDSEPIMSTWTNDPPTIDGLGNDWETAGFTFIDEIRGAVAVANNDSSVYLLIRYRDQDLARKASVGGFTLWWGLDGEKRQDIGIRFPGRDSIGDIIEHMGSMKDRQNGQNDEYPPRESMEHGSPPRFAQHDNGNIHGEMEVVFGDLDSPIPILERYADAGYQYYKGSYIYEFAIPFSAIRTLTDETGNRDITEVSFNVTLGGISDEDRDRLKNAMPDDRRGGPPEGMGDRGDGMGGPGGGPGSGPGGGPGGGPMGRRQSPDESFSAEEIWFKVQLGEAPSSDLLEPLE